MQTSTEKYQKSRGTETDASLLFKTQQISGGPAKSPKVTSELEFVEPTSSSSEISRDLAESNQRLLLLLRRNSTIMIIDKNPKLYLEIPVKVYVLVNFLCGVLEFHTQM